MILVVNPAADSILARQMISALYIRDTENAQIFMAHDPELFKATKQAPEFYD